MKTEVDQFLHNAQKWGQEMQLLRSIALDCMLTEEFKWRQPCYTFQNKNILIISGFKAYCALNFFKGSLLPDEQGLMVAPGKNSQSGRQIRFTDADEILRKKDILKSYIYEAIEIEKAGKCVSFKKASTYTVPAELQEMLDKNKTLRTAFNALTPGRQKGYYLFIAAAKQSSTRKARIEKNVQRILSGKGLNDCVCGLSKKYPSCDGSHKFLA
ncbi:MAG: YdeI/OmpD-associated family protein [Vicingaceae bacterium]